MKIKNHQVLAIKDKSNLYVSKLNEIFIYNIETKRLEKIYSFKSDLKTVLSQFSRVLRRLFRKDIRYAYLDNERYLLLIRDNKIYRLDVLCHEIVSVVELPRGSRPLNMIKISSLEGFQDGIYFGEYFNNPSKKNVLIYQYLNNSIKVAYEFPQGSINHIHNLVVDHHQKCLWILNGDFDESASIYQAINGFKSVKRIVSGRQIFRSCVAFPTQEGLVYATDSQFEQNTIRLLYKIDEQWKTKTLFDMNGPCIFGTQIDHNFYFSTSVEAINSGNVIKKLLRNKRGPGIIKNQSEIVKGNLQNGFRKIYDNKKDKLPYIPFQFGNILFPSGENQIKKLVFTNIALKNDDLTTIILDI